METNTTIARTLICGSRTYQDYETLERICLKVLHRIGRRNIEIVEGGASGADALAKRFAEKHTRIHTQFTADWAKFGKKAGYIRNCVMGEYCEFGICIAFWDGKSPGTKMMIDLALSTYNMKVYVCNYITNKLTILE